MIETDTPDENLPEGNNSIARLDSYFFAGGFPGAGAGAAGCVLAGADFTPCNTELGPPCLMA